MADESSPANLELHYLVPTVTSDGSSVAISTDGDVPTVTFFQVRTQDNNTVRADGVASIRMRNLDELRGLQHNIEEAIRNHENREQ